jgi:hypothetical protein
MPKHPKKMAFFSLKNQNFSLLPENQPFLASPASSNAMAG